MIFHNASKYIYNWIDKNPSIKEESLTDWLLHDVSLNLPNIKYYEFTRHEESTTGADWDWWILTKDKYKRLVGFHFLVQAKKINTKSNNYNKINYKKGEQIKSLLDFANNNNALPLYVYYSTTQPNYKEQLKNFPLDVKPLIDWCKPCTNGAFLSLATTANELLNCVTDKKLLDTTLINYALGLSVLDGYNSSNGLVPLHMLNRYYKKIFLNNNLYQKENLIDGICYSEEAIPLYVQTLIEQQGQLHDLYFEEYSHIPLLSKVNGIGIINLL